MTGRASWLAVYGREDALVVGRPDMFERKAELVGGIPLALSVRVLAAGLNVYAGRIESRLWCFPVAGRALRVTGRGVVGMGMGIVL